MKIKRWLSTIMAMCIFMSLITCMPVSAAAQEWTYCLKVQISDAKDSKSKDGILKGICISTVRQMKKFLLCRIQKHLAKCQKLHTHLQELLGLLIK